MSTTRKKSSPTSTVSVKGQSGIRSTLCNGVVHDYVLNDAKASKVMVKNAGLPPISAPDLTSQTSQLQLSTGSFSQVIQPLFNHWTTFNLAQGQELVEGETKVNLLDVRIDTEATDKKVDALAKFDYNYTPISFFAYCTNQTIMIQGKNHKVFLDKFLTPLLARMINDKKNEITKFNNMVISELSVKSRNVDQDDSVWSCATPNRETLNVKLRRNTQCHICGKNCAGISQLKIHITNAHTNVTRAKPRAVTRSRQLLTTVSKEVTTVNAINQDGFDTSDTSEEEESSLEETACESIKSKPETSNPPSPLHRRSRSNSCPDFPPPTSSTAPLLEPNEAPSLVLPAPDKTPPIASHGPPSPSLQKPSPPPPASTPDTTKSTSTTVDPLTETGPPILEAGLLLEVVPDPPPPDAKKSRSTLGDVSKPDDPDDPKSDKPNPDDPKPEESTSDEPNPERVEIYLESGGVASLDVIVLSKSQVIPESAWAEALNKSIEFDKNAENNQDEIEVVEQDQPFQCAVCEKFFMDQESVTTHFESHGNAQSVISLMKRMHNLENIWLTRFNEQKLLVRSLELQVHNLQARAPTPILLPPPPVPAFPSSTPETSSSSVSQPPSSNRSFPSTQQPHTYAQTVRGAPAPVRESPPSDSTFNCPDCRYKCSSLTKLDRHIAFKHQRPNHDAIHTLFVGDSRVKSLKPRIVEKALGGGRLSVPGSLKVPELPQGRNKGHPGRGYCSSRDWPYSKFPEASLEDRVPGLLAARPFTNLILQAPCSDITNITKVTDKSKHQDLAALSAHNTLAVVERALRVTPSLEKVVILEQLPRADGNYLTTLSEHSKVVLRDLVASSNLRDHITIASSQPLQCQSEAQLVEMFGARDDSRSDGIHLAGEHGKQLYTDFVLSSLKSATLGWTSPSRRAGLARQTPRREGGEEQDGWANGNRFGPLSN